MEVGCVTFGMKCRKKPKKCSRDNGLQGWNDVAVWRDGGRISIRICGWRQDRLVDQKQIGCMDSPTLRSRTCGRPVVSQPLGALNQYRAPSSLRRSIVALNNI
jgi:hypothetical protein